MQKENRAYVSKMLAIEGDFNCFMAVRVCV